jgi:hypothetical protein
MRTRNEAREKEREREREYKLGFKKKTQKLFGTQQEVCHTMATPFTLKKYLKAKRRIMEIQIFHHAKI